LTRESRPLAPGNYTIKYVIHDVRDLNVDSAIFIPEDSVKVYSLAQGDYNGDVAANAADYTVWRNNKSLPVPPEGWDFRDGDGNGDGILDSADFQIWHDHYGDTGNRDWRSDFNRDGVLNYSDLLGILGQYMDTAACASRFEGDADSDGDVDMDDANIWMEEDAIEGGGGGSAMMSGGEGDEEFTDAEAQACLASIGYVPSVDLLANVKNLFSSAVGQMEVALAPLAKDMIPANPDVDGDGDVDEADIAVLDAIILGK
jgi:hypothetical protein